MIFIGDEDEPVVVHGRVNNSPNGVVLFPHGTGDDMICFSSRDEALFWTHHVLSQLEADSLPDRDEWESGLGLEV